MVSKNAKAGDWAVNSRLLAKIKRFGQQLYQTQFDSNIGVCTFLNKAVSQ